LNALSKVKDKKIDSDMGRSGVRRQGSIVRSFVKRNVPMRDVLESNVRMAQWLIAVHSWIFFSVADSAQQRILRSTFWARASVSII
jgi:hypothetical protein